MVNRAVAPLAALVLWLGLAGAASPARAAPAVEAPEPSPAVLQMADWVIGSGDNQDLPFVIIDKSAAMVAVFDADGEMLGAEPALVGLAFGDNSTPGIGDRELSDIPPEERTTPAGRFVGGYGPAEGKHEDVLWVDFGSAISLHAVVTTNPEEKRVQRLKSPAVDDNRITYGCINVSKKFYKTVVRPTFADTKGVFYILPDTRMPSEVFPGFGVEATPASPGGPPASSGMRALHRPSVLW